MAAQTAAAAAESAPASWPLLSQGAEARVYELDLCGFPAVAKHRFEKSYRIKEVDARLRKERTLAEARCLARCWRAGVPAPALLAADTARYTLYLERVPGRTAKAFVDAFRDSAPVAVRSVLRAFGAAVAKLHGAGLTHGDLTTSNVICRRPPGDAADAAVAGVVLIDFGLGATNASVEDKAVDLYVLERALVSTHRDADDLLEGVLAAYAADLGAPAARPVLARLDTVRARGRKRECFG